MINCGDIKERAEFSGPDIKVDVEQIPRLDNYWNDAGNSLIWECLFMLPPWLGAWWLHFGQGSRTFLWTLKKSDEIIGVAPLVIEGETARLIGDSELMDYSDFAVSPSQGKEFFEGLFAHMRNKGIRRFEIGRIRSDSAALSRLTASPPPGSAVSCEPVDVLYEMDLPGSWEGYLNLLSGKERHETRRKLSRLESSGHVRLRVVEGGKEVAVSMDIFLTLFRSSSTEKAEFMTASFESFFRSLAERTAAAGILKLFFLEFNGEPVASTMCFDYNSTVYLYNNGYDPRLGHLGVGLLSKVLSIRESIMLGRKKYNFLRGGETYKQRLGGSPVNLCRCEVVLK